MFFKSYDGWKAVGDTHKKAVLAKFTKEDGETVHYNFAALRRMAKKPSETMEQADVKLLKQAVGEGPSFFRSFLGWKNFGRDGKTIMMAQFTNSTGLEISRNLSSLQRMAANPPKKFSAFDAVMLETVIQDGPPAPRR